MSKSFGPILFGVIVAMVVGFLMGFAASAAGEEPGITPALTGLCFGIVTTIVVYNLSGNRKVADADPETRTRALAFETDPARAALYLVRTGGVDQASSMNVAINGREVAQLKSPRFTRVTLLPGAHKLTAAFAGGLAAQTKPVEYAFTAAASEIIVLRLTMGVGAIRNPVQVERVNVDWARGELSSMRMTAPDLVTI